ncbi:MAG: bifunctional riboflavin kinase/FAD synthetase [Frankiales bacterium]|nr:bifunctional riboflavin kinase/FAD synthetase [Frankiales bacterium]
MQRWQGLEDVPDDQPRSVVAIGVFDGVHYGHRQVIGRAVAHGRELGAPVVVVTFDPHPDEVVRPGTHPALLSTVDQRCALLAELGVDAVCVLPFTLELAALSPEEFVEQVIVERFHALAVVVGDNFRFGHRAAGDTETLADLGAERGFVVDAAPLVAGEGGVWSSTYVRGLIRAGDVAQAAYSLLRPHRVEGSVVHGDKRGRELGYPTANLATTPHAAVPADGVYAAWLVVAPYTEHAVRLPAAVSVGTNPTFGGRERRVEAHVLDRDDLDLYGAHVALDFVARIRGQLTFSGDDAALALTAQMARDVDSARLLLAEPPVARPTGP